MIINRDVTFNELEMTLLKNDTHQVTEKVGGANIEVSSESIKENDDSADDTAINTHQTKEEEGQDISRKLVQCVRFVSAELRESSAVVYCKA